MSTIGFIGIGVMGLPMARNLIRGGHHVRAYDIDPGALERIRPDGAEIAGSAREAAAGADFVVTMLPNGEHVEAALFGPDGIADALGEDALLIEMSTILPAFTDRFGEALGNRARRMVDAPVGRSSKHAEEGKLLIMAGGDAADVERARPILELLGDTIVHCGPLGAGARMKLVNNYLAIASNVAVAESLTLAEKSGLDRDLAVRVMSGTTAGQGHLATTYPAKALKGDLTPGFMIDLAHKDMGLALEMAAGLQVPAALGALARQVYAIAQVQGRGRDDWTAIYPTVRRLAGLE